MLIDHQQQRGRIENGERCVSAKRGKDRHVKEVTVGGEKRQSIRYALWMESRKKTKLNRGQAAAVNMSGLLEIGSTSPENV